MFIQHQGNEPSGGRVTDIEIGAFLGTGARGPEHQELLRLIGTLVEEPALKGKGMPDEVGGEHVATNIAFKVLAQLLHQREVLDPVEFAEELEVRAMFLAKPEGGGEIAQTATHAAGVLDELAQSLREVTPDADPEGLGRDPA